MNIAEAIKGTRFRLVDDRASKGEIKSTDGRTVMVRFDGHSSNDELDIDEIVLENLEEDKAIAAKVQVKIDEAQNAFEQAFKALKEAENVSEDGFYWLEDSDLVSLKGLKNAIESHGWSYSSLWC